MKTETTLSTGSALLVPGWYYWLKIPTLLERCIVAKSNNRHRCIDDNDAFYSLGFEPSLCDEMLDARCELCTKHR